MERRVWGPSTLLKTYQFLRRATVWMASDGRGRWSSLSAGDVARLKEHLYHVDRSGPPPGSGTRYQALGALVAMHTLYVRGSIPDGPAVDPRIDDAACVRRVLAAYREVDPDHVDQGRQGTKSIPWGLAQDFLKAAIDLVEHPLADDIIAMASELRSLALHDGAPDRLPAGQISYRESRLLRRWHRNARERRVLDGFGIETTMEVKQLAQDLLTACWLITDLFGALRIEEAASLAAEAAVAQRNDGWWLNSVVRKTSPETAGSLVPLPVPPIVERAVELTRRATAVYRGDMKHLFAFESRGHVATLSSSYAVKLMRRFARHRCDAPGAADFPFAPHQLRKLYVQLMARRFNGKLEVAQQHLRHVSAKMIEEYARDPELVRMLVAEQVEVAAEVMLGVMHGTEAAVGQPAERWRAQAVRYQGRTLTLRRASALVTREQLRLEPTSIGYCASGRPAAPAAACGTGGDGLPDRANARPGKCLACSNSLTLARHAPMLKALYLVHRQVVDSADAAEPLRTASERQCRMIARRLAALAGRDGGDA